MKTTCCAMTVRWILFAPPECDHGTGMFDVCEKCEREYESEAV